MSNQKRKKVIITGAAGRIGRYLTRHLSPEYDLLLVDKEQPADETDHAFNKCDITDLDSMRELCRGVHTVIHLAADARVRAEWEDLYQPNIVGAYTVFQAAHESGCRRMIFASSCHAVLGYADDVQVNTQMSVRPPNLYGATKIWGEALGRYYADQKGLPTICLRIGWVIERSKLRKKSKEDNNLPLALTYEDLGRLFSSSLQAGDDLHFAIFHGVSDNHFKRLDISNARDSIGYAPQDDAFQLAGQEVEEENPRGEQTIKKIRRRVSWFLRGRGVYK